MDCSCIKINCNVNPWDIISSLLGNGARYLAGVCKSNTDTLVDEAKRLPAIKNDVNTAVVAAEFMELRKRRHDVDLWITEVDNILEEVRAFEASRIYRIPCVRDCPCWATDMLVRVRRLITRGELLRKGEEPLGEEPLQSIRVPKPELVGGEESLEAVLRLRTSATIRLIGIHGMRGIGKTALLQNIYHELKAQQQQVIYAVVSKEVNILRLQKVIGRQLGLPITDERSQDGASPESRQAATLLVKLRDSSVTLLLDDVWEPLQWEDIGIPPPAEPEGGCKIIFTTPFQQICASMGVGQDTIKVSFLNDAQSWALFCLKMRKPVDDTSIDCLRQVISRCGGLPRAIITFYDHVASNNTVLNGRFEMEQRWENSLHDIMILKERVLDPLKCMCDELEKRSFHPIEERTREMMQCLLYCSLFPEDRSIYTDQLIDYWIGEGFLDFNCDSMLSEARNKGYEIIRTLVKECFLQSVFRSDDRQVKLHDMVRCMALWLTNGESQPPRLFLTSTKLRNCTNRAWEKAQRISSMGNGVKNIPSNLEGCPILLTLLFNNGSIDHLHNIQADRSTITGRPEDLFKIARNLRVLDLSGTDIVSLPAEIGLMTQVQYLNLSYTKIRSLPKEVSKLGYLRQLKLRGTSHLSSIPVRSIPPSILQMFDLLGSVYTWQPPRGYRLPWLQQINLEHFSEDTWNYLTEFGLTIRTSHSGLIKLCKSEKLCGCIVFLELLDIAGLSNLHLSSVFRTMGILRELFISDCGLTELELITGLVAKLEILKLCNLSSLSTISVIEEADLLLRSLRQLHVSNCPQLTHISWVHQLPNLLEIEMTDCSGVEELVVVQTTGDVCSLSEKLREIRLIQLENLRRITCGHLRSPSLEVLSVSRCSLFKRISFDGETTLNIKKISGETQWWESLQWDGDGITEWILRSRFVEAH